MQYTLRNVPAELDKALRERAQEEGKSLNEVTLEILRSSMGLGGEPVRHRDLGDVAGTWIDDPAVDEALSAQRQIDPEMWK